MLHKLFLFFLTIIVSFGHNTMGQTSKKADSLFTIINKMNDDTTKILKLFEIGIPLEETDSLLCNKIYTEAISISKKINNPIFECNALIKRGVLDITNERFSQGRTFYQKAYELALKIKNQKYAAKALGSIGISYSYEDNYTEAFTYMFKAVDYMERMKDYRSLTTMYTNIARIYSQQELFENELKYGKKCLESALLSKDSIAIGAAYTNLSIACTNSKDTVTSFRYILNALNYIRTSPYKSHLHYVFNEVAVGYKNIGNYKMAKAYNDSSLSIAKSLGYSNEIAGGLMLKADIAMLEKDYNTASLQMKDAKQYVDLYNSWPMHSTWNAKMKELEEVKGNYKAALEYNDQYLLYKDSLEDKDTKAQNATLEKKYETEKKETQLKLQQSTIKQKNTLNILFGSIAAAILVISLFGFKNYKHKQTLQQQKISELETQQQLTATEAVLKGEEQERTRLAKDLHDGLGGMLSGIKYSFNTMKGNMIMTPDNAQAFERSMDMLDSSIKEMRRVAHNMMPEALVKFGLDTALKDFCNEIQQSGAVQISYQSIGLENTVIDQTVSITVYRIVQELINNTMKHAMAKTAIVQVTKSNGQLSVTVEDDGKGFDTAIINNPVGMGWSNITNRVEFLKGKLDVDSQSGKGTSVHIEINI
jgi:two-component system, NarL family, sensor kinase